MIEEPKRTLAYLCPKCGQSVAVERTVFQLAATENKLPCPCGGSMLKVEMEADHVDLTVPCVSCGKDHHVRCSAHDFLHQKAMAFSCAATGLDCCYVGEEGPVYAATARLERAVDKLEEHEKEQESEDGEKSPFLDEIVMHEVLSEIKDIASRDGISCTCGSRKWNLKVNYSSVDLTCAACGAQMRIPAATADDIDDICCKPMLLIRGRKD